MSKIAKFFIRKARLKRKLYVFLKLQVKTLLDIVSRLPDSAFSGW